MGIRDFLQLPKRASRAINSGPLPGKRPNRLPDWLPHGGAVNPTTGMGTPGIDKSESTFYLPTHWTNRADLEVLYVQSWACQHFVDLPVDDMLIRGRQFIGSETSIDRMVEEERRTRAMRALADAMKAGRLFGTGLLVMVTREAPLDTPLDPMRLRRGDLQSLLVFDRFSAAIAEWDEDIASRDYGQPIYYDIFPRHGQAMRVDASRVLRFDGHRPLTHTGWDVYDRDWGVSAVVPVLSAILQDQTIASGAAHLAQETSIPVVKVNDFHDHLAGEPNPNSPNPVQFAEALNCLKSIYRTMFIGPDDDADRMAVSWGGYPDLMDRFARRVAAAAGIPATRFWGQSPLGMDATGDSDMANYQTFVGALQTQLLTEPLLKLDAVMARSAGLGDALEYEWVSMADTRPDVAAVTAKTKAEAAQIAITAGMIDEDEGRAALTGDDVFGDLPEGMAPGVPMPEPEAGPEKGPE